VTDFAMHSDATQISDSGLTDKQEHFAHGYLIDQNASAACSRAGLRAQGAQLMARPAVWARAVGGGA